MNEDRSAASAAASLTAFAVAGSITTAQEIATILIDSMKGADRTVVAEETLSLIAVVSARAVESGADSLISSAASQAILALPFTYHDYLLGGELLAASAGGARDASVYGRLVRKREFYTLHLPSGQLPSPRMLREKMELWMGRLSPPGLPEHPALRLEKLALVEVVATHAKLVYEFARKKQADSATAASRS
ncbi:MAG: hypothetical protein KJO98_14990 [Rhodothermia bacterium]|nr:hypothetical protein [Rhodothermia bacterium]